MRAEKRIKIGDKEVVVKEASIKTIFKLASDLYTAPYEFIQENTSLSREEFEELPAWAFKKIEEAFISLNPDLFDGKGVEEAIDKKKLKS
ncbi:MAG: hypothetical protein C6I01_01865 [Epsilonproteobacteria bacterium]|nr:hypothetical protein [Campylobacterota bacterium]